MSRIQNLKYQIGWVASVASVVAALQILSGFAGEAGDFLSRTFSRIVLHFDAIFEYIWSTISKYSGIDFSPYSNQLTFSAIILFPYLFRWKNIKAGFVLDDQYPALALLNLASVSVISSAIPYFRPENWFFAATMAPFSFYFIFLSMYSIYRDGDYRLISRYLVLILGSIGILLSMYLIYIDFDEISKLENPTIAFITTSAASTSYVIGILLRLEGYYPFLYACIMYLVLFSIDYFLREFAPRVDAFLTSIGAN